MRTRKLGATDLNLSTVGLGTWPMGSVYGGMTWGPQDDQASINTVIRAVEQGINWLDTAPAYGRGHSEEVLGMAFRKLTRRPIVVTKCGSTWDETGKAAFRLDQASVRAQCEASLKRMGIDTLDLYLVHWPNPIEYMEEGWRTCSELVKEGKIRYIGVSNFTIEQMDKLQPIHPIAAMEPPYSMIERRIETGILDYCRQHHMGVIIYSPLQQGLLTGTIKVEDLAPNDFRRANPHFKEPELILNLKLAGDLTPIARKYNCSIAQIAIAWTLRKPEVTAALNGARDPSEIEDSVKAADIILADNDIEEIEKLLVERQNKVPPPPPPGGPPGGVPPGLPPGR
jgi:aryl-alcohol dehydrogenase-like predicted oxidoreductase